MNNNKFRLSPKSKLGIVFTEVFSLIFIYFFILIIFFVLVAIYDNEVHLVLLSISFVVVLVIIGMDYFNRLNCQANLSYDEEAIFIGDNFLIKISDVLELKRASLWPLSKFYLIKYRIDKLKTKKIYFFPEPEPIDFFESLFFSSRKLFRENNNINNLRKIVLTKTHNHSIT